MATAQLNEARLHETPESHAPTRFHVGLNVSNLGRSVAFYRLLLGIEPAKRLADYARFELDRPPLVLALYPSPQSPGGPLNHVGLRLPSSEALVEVQHRLEEAGIATQRQEGVECCYARQSKFWVSDPDRTLWEIYTLHEDIEHSGFDDPPVQQPPASTVWQHRLTDPLPQRIPHEADTVDEICLEGTLNADLSEAVLAAFLGDVFRVLKPGAQVSVHGLVGDKPFPGRPKLPGMASLVQRVPLLTEAQDVLEAAGFHHFTYDRLNAIHCFGVRGIELSELRLLAFKPCTAAETAARPVMYKGPFEEVVDEHGTHFVRGVRVLIQAEHAEDLRRGPVADRFAFLPRD